MQSGRFQAPGISEVDIGLAWRPIVIFLDFDYESCAFRPLIFDPVRKNRSAFYGQIECRTAFDLNVNFFVVRVRPAALVHVQLAVSELYFSGSRFQIPVFIAVECFTCDVHFVMSVDFPECYRSGIVVFYDF